MSATWVIKLPSSESAGTPVLIHVTRKEGRGLDLDLLATDGDAAFKGKVRERSLKKLRSKSYEGSDDDWSAILEYVLVSKQSSKISDVARNNLELSYSISGKDPKATVTLSFRSRVEDITQRLGSIELLQTSDTDNVDLFGWASEVTDRRDDLEKQIILQKQTAEKAGETITTLRTQLADLIKAKEEHETELLSKFTLLLNEKKRALRDRQRVVSVSKVSEKKLSTWEKELNSAGQTSTHRAKKRKIANAAQEEDLESDGFEQLQADVSADAGEDEVSNRSSRSTTPRQSEDEDETDEDLDQPVASKTRASISNAREGPGENSSSLPPPRELPFQQKGKAAAQKAKEPMSPSDSADEEETASEDDEL